MQMSSSRVGDAQIVTVEDDRIDAEVAIAFKDQMRKLTKDDAKHVILDLSHVDFIDSSGLGAIVAAMKQMGRDRVLHLAGAQPNVDKVFRLTRMDKIFKIHPNVDQALAAEPG